MKLHLKSIMTIGLLVVAVTSKAQVDEAQLSGYEVKNGFAGGLCGNLHIPCGWEAARRHHFNNLKSKKIAAGKARLILDKITTQYPDYRWSKDGGVVNIRPKGNTKSVLDKTIPALDISSGTVKDARQSICEAAKLDCRWRIEAGPRQHFKQIELHLKNISVLTALNRLAETDGMVSWTTEYDDATGNPTIDFWSWRKGPSLFEEKK